MTPVIPSTSLELRSLVTEQGTLELSLIDVPVPIPRPGQVLIRVEAAPINPSDLGLLFAGADMTAATVSGTPDRPVVTTPLSDGALRALAARVGRSLSVGNEGAGTVVATGDSPEAQALTGTDCLGRGRCDVHPVPGVRSVGVPRPARRYASKGRSVILCQSAHRARNDRDDASGGSQRPRPHGGGVEPGADAGQALSRRGRAARQHRAQARASGDSCDPSAPSTSATPVRRRSSAISEMPSLRRRPRSPSTPRVGGISPVRSSLPWRWRPPNPPRSTRGMGRPFGSRCTSTEASTRAQPS